MKLTVPKKNFFERLSTRVTKMVGSSWAFTIAVTVVVVWLLTGPIFNYSDTWQLVINTGTTIVTFLMVFLIQHSQNKESRALQVKLNELIASSDKASNRLIDVEDLNEEELIALQNFYVELVKMSKKDKNFSQSHSVDEAIAIHERKSKGVKKGT
jgi:low affinity Fe/Cu permease